MLFRSKIELLKYSQFGNTLFIDVDSMAFKNIEPLIDELIAKGMQIGTMVYDNYKLTDGDDVQKLNWAYGNDIFEFYQLHKKQQLPCINTSIIFYNQSAIPFFDEVLAKFNYPANQLKLNWGGTMPDELPFSVALVGKKDYCIPECAMLFGNKSLPEADLELKEKYYLMSIYGGRNFTKLRFTDIYDKTMAKYYKEIGQEYQYKYHLTISEKHANKSVQVLIKPQLDPFTLPEIMSAAKIGRAHV